MHNLQWLSKFYEQKVKEVEDVEDAEAKNEITNVGICTAARSPKIPVLKAQTTLKSHHSICLPHR